MNVHDIVEAQKRYFNGNHTKPLEFRLEQLSRFRSMIKSNESAFNDAIKKDFGKGEFETFMAELYLVYEEIETALQKLHEWTKPQAVDATLMTSPSNCYVMPEPLGVSLVIGPWNYPLQLTLAPVVAAIAAGCTVVLKPSELTPNSSALLTRLIAETFEPHYVTVVEGGVPETTELLAEKYDIIFFTGSVPVGKIVYQAAAKHLTPVVLELGGKSPTIIAEDANLDITVRRLVWAKYLNAGQTCIAPDYVYVHRSLYPAFLEKAAKEIAQSDFKVENGNYVQIVNARNTQRVADMIDPSKVIVGGTFDIEARTIEPTIMKDVNWSDKVMQDEIFGPLMPTMAYDDIDEVIANIKSHDKPLALYLFTENEALKKKVLREVSFGGGCINDAVMHIANGHLPFGGVGASGIGSYHGFAGFRAFSHFKSIVDRAVIEDPDLKYSPHTSEKLLLMKQITNVA